MKRIHFQATTLVEALHHWVDQTPDETHLILLDERGRSPLTYRELLRGATAVAERLRAEGVEPRQTVALMLPTGREFFFSFTGALLAGAVPVPIYPPVQIDQIEEYATRQVGILANAEVHALLAPRQARKLARLLKPRVPSLRAILEPEEIVAATSSPGEIPTPSPDPDDLALIQYTSGSTGDPKGVSLSHGNLIANIRSIGEAVGVNDEDVVVSWLPLYHDMGLIGCWLFALCHGLPMVCFSPLDFLRQPKRWLRALSDYRGTLSPAPNFAYELCLRRIRDRDLAGVDLSSWRMALNGAEPVKPETLERFIARFGEYGFQKGAMAPVYGLAENAVALTFPPLGRGPRIEAVAREPFQRDGRAIPVEDAPEAEDDEEPLRTIGVGKPIPGNEVRVVDSKDRPVGERQEGHVQFRGPSATRGYYRNAKATAAIRTEDGWTRTGDRGYFADGELFITGRQKDLIIKAGRNLDPAEVESLAAQVEGVRKGCVVAFGTPSPSTGSEDLVLVAETRVSDPEARKRMASEVRRAVRSVIKVSPDAIQFVPPRTVPKTPSGKLRRAETRQRYLSGALVRRRPPVWVQVVRLAAGALGAGGVGLGAFFLRRRARRRSEER